MSVFFFDSSALAKRYLIETGSSWVEAQIDLATGNTAVVAEITRVEVAAALAARHRAGAINLLERDNLVALLLRHFDTEYRLVALDASGISHAVELTQRYRLRGYDAVQLAAALAANAVLGYIQFVAADDDLLAAARPSVRAVDNPNMH